MGQQRRLGPGGAMAMAMAVTTLGTALDIALGGQDRRDRQHPRQIVNRLFGGLAQRLQIGAARRFHFDGEGHMAVLDGNAGDHAEADDVGLLVGVVDVLQRLDDLLLGDLGHGRPLF